MMLHATGMKPERSDIRISYFLFIDDCLIFAKLFIKYQDGIYYFT